MAKPLTTSSSVQPLEWEEVQEMEQGCEERENEYGDEEEDRLDAGLHCSHGLGDTRTHSDSVYARLKARSGCAPRSRRCKIRVLLRKLTMAMAKKKYPEEPEQCCKERENESGDEEDSPIFFDPTFLHSLLDRRDEAHNNDPPFLFSLLDSREEEDSSSDEEDRLDAGLHFSQGTRAHNDSLFRAAPHGSWSNFHPIY